MLASGDNYEAGSTGGEVEHTLIVQELPIIKGQLAFNSAGNTQGIISSDGTGGVFSIIQKSTGGFQPNNKIEDATSGRRAELSFGANQPHNNMPPYLSVYCWECIA